MLTKPYQVLETSEVRALLENLHEDVTRDHERVVIVRPGSDARCVLISQAELDAMERALEILSGTTDAAIMRQEVARIADDLAARSRVPAGSLS